MVDRSKKRRVAFYTLGCKANQADTDSLKRDFLSYGFEIGSYKDEADIYFVNTCTVTSKASTQSRQTIRKFCRNHPKSKIIVIGCDVEFEREKLQKIDGVELVVGNKEREKIDLWVKANYEIVPEKLATPSFDKTRSRPFVRIQDGCENFCSYCIVPYTRGCYKSEDPKNIISIIDEISKEGFFEVVLTGIHIGMYGVDFDKKYRLVDLLNDVLAQTDVGRIRLSSLEPDEIDDDLLNLIRESNGRIAPHLHIPLQSGSDKILKLMKRKYTTEDYRKLIEKVRNIIPECSVGADVITGFPGENEDDFKRAYSFISELPISYLHVFTYSDREGTVSFDMPDKVIEIDKKERTKLLRGLSVEKRRAYLHKWLDKKVTVIFDKNRVNGYHKGCSENYITVLVKDVPEKRDAYQVRLEEISGESMIGKLV